MPPVESAKSMPLVPLGHMKQVLEQKLKTQPVHPMSVDARAALLRQEPNAQNTVRKSANAAVVRKNASLILMKKSATVGPVIKKLVLRVFCVQPGITAVQILLLVTCALLDTA